MRWIPAATAAALGLYQLGEPSLWIDEAFTARAVGPDAPPLSEEVHALYYALMRAWTEIAGTTEFALRFPSVVAFVLAVVLLQGLASRLFDDRVGLVSASLLAVNPLMVQWSQQARSYTFLVCLAIGATWLLVAKRWFAYALVLALLIHVQFFSAFLLLAAHVPASWRDRRAWLTRTLAVVISVPWLVHTLSRGTTGSPVEWLRPPEIEELGAALGVTGALGVGLLVAFAGLRLPHHRSLLAAWAFVPAVVALMGTAWKPMFLDRYLLVSSPAFATLGATALTALAGRTRLVSAGALTAGTLTGLVLWYAPSGGDNWKEENWRAATAYVMSHGGAYVIPEWAAPAYRYYGGRQTRGAWLLYRVPEWRPESQLGRPFGTRLRLIRVDT